MTASQRPARFAVIGIKGTGRGHIGAVQALANEGRARLVTICRQFAAKV